MASRRHRFLIIASVLILTMLFLSISVTSAAGGSLRFKVDCAGFTSQGSRLDLTRDNTGQLAEAFVISAIDGGGNTIFEPVSDVFFVGSSVTWPLGDTYNWTQAPRWNPIRLQIVSVAGNDKPEQLVYELTGNCTGLPRFGAINVAESFLQEAIRRLTGEAFVLQPADGVTSAPIQLNETPPRPVNPEWLAEEQPGYAIVNTDNQFLRTGDNPDYTVIGIVDGGTRLAVLGRNEDRSWWYVQVGGLRGWMSAEFLILRGDLTGIREVPVQGSIIAPTLYVGFGGNPVYALPQLGTATLCTIPGGQEYAIIGRTRGSSWYQVEVICNGLGTSGWLPAEQGLVRNPAGVPIPITY